MILTNKASTIIAAAKAQKGPNDVSDKIIKNMCNSGLLTETLMISMLHHFEYRPIWVLHFEGFITISEQFSRYVILGIGPQSVCLLSLEAPVGHFTQQ